jgi:hypothetical protein
MKRAFAIIVAVIGVGAAIAWAKRLFDHQATEGARERSELRLRVEYLERAAWVRLVPEPKAYRDEVGSLLAWYFKALDEHLVRHGGNRKFDDYLIELEERARKVSAARFDESARDHGEEKRAVYESTRRLFDAMRDRTYSPVWTATDQGIRFDVLSADPVRIGAEEKIRLPLVVWGLPREERTDERGVKRVKSNASFRFSWKLFDARQKLLGEVTGDGDPQGRVDFPERYVKAFPPLALLGSYEVDKVPSEASRAEITFSVVVRAATGGTLTPSFTWKLEIPQAWKLAPGEAWKGAEESVRPEEEIDPTRPKPR